MYTRKFVSVFGLALATALSVAVPAASAEDSFGAAACVVGGAAGTANVESVGNDLLVNRSGDSTGAWDPLRLLDTDNGTFQFSSDAVACAAVDAGGTTPGIAAGLYSINASGSYTNLVCGTGSADGTATLSGTAAIGGAATITSEFGINFVGGVGALTLNHASGTANILPLPSTAGQNPQTITNGSGAGVVDIVPTAGTTTTTTTVPCVSGGPFALTAGDDGDVTNFRVSAAFTTTLEG